MPLLKPSRFMRLPGNSAGNRRTRRPPSCQAPDHPHHAVSGRLAGGRRRRRRGLRPGPPGFHRPREPGRQLLRGHRGRRSAPAPQETPAPLPAQPVSPATVPAAPRRHAAGSGGPGIQLRPEPRLSRPATRPPLRPRPSRTCPSRKTSRRTSRTCRTGCRTARDSPQRCPCRPPLQSLCPASSRSAATAAASSPASMWP